MKKRWSQAVALSLGAAAVWSAGCNCDRTTITMTQTPAERRHSLAAVVDTDCKGLVEDSDLFWQCDRPTRLTRWHER